MDVNNRRNSFFIVAGVAVIFGIMLLFQWVLNDDSYIIDEEKFRKKRDEFFATDPQSPIPDSLRKDFKGLKWFPLNRDYKVFAKFEKNPKFEQIEMARSVAGPETYVKAGWVHFNLQGKDLVLTVYNPNVRDSKTIFVPFRDATSGKTTYGGGRYIDTRLANDAVELDFNRAYNPYCVWNFSFACPVPPEENRLNFAIEAGEMMTPE
jgi:uncharacterized protein